MNCIVFVFIYCTYPKLFKVVNKNNYYYSFLVGVRLDVCFAKVLLAATISP